MPWEKQKELQAQDIPTYEEIYQVCISIDNLKHRALFALVYLTAGRISEVVREIEVPHFTKEVMNQEEYLHIRMPNRKHKTRKRKLIPISYAREARYIDIIREYLNNLRYATSG